jgi:hypothetical protein
MTFFSATIGRILFFLFANVAIANTVLAQPVADKQNQDSAKTISTPLSSENGFAQLGGNLPKVIAARNKPYIVCADIYVPSGKTVTVEPGVIMLFKNFTGLHVEGRLVAEGSELKPIVFSSEFDTTYNPTATQHATPYDWNGLYLLESGIGSSFAYCTIAYSVYGFNALTKYIKLDHVSFAGNGRANLTINGKQELVTSRPFSYALTIEDARKDGVPVKILMDPHAAKRNGLRYGGIGLFIGGMGIGIWNCIQLNQDLHRLSELKDTRVTSENSNLVKNLLSDWDKAEGDKNRNTGFAAAGFILAVIGGAGFSFSLTF